MLKLAKHISHKTIRLLKNYISQGNIRKSIYRVCLAWKHKLIPQPTQEAEAGGARAQGQSGNVGIAMSQTQMKQAKGVALRELA